MRLSDRLEEVLRIIMDCVLNSSASAANANAIEFKTQSDNSELQSILLADIGTDHAYIPVEAVGRGIVSCAIASDIGEGPAAAAREHVAMAGLEGKIKVVVADGLAGVDASFACPDIIVITGMGGNLIMQILEDGKEKAHAAKDLVLSPQSDIPLFRTYLMGAGYETISESIVLDEGKYYFIIRARYNAQNTSGVDQATDFDKLLIEGTYGKREHFSEEGLKLRAELIARDIENYKNIYEQIKSQSSNPEQASQIQKLIDSLEGALANGL